MTRAILASIVACTWSGVPLLLGWAWERLRLLVSKDKWYLYDDGFGWRSQDPAMLDAWQRVRENPWSFHHLKNLLVEWFRLNSQRAAKSACAAVFFAFVVGFVSGVLL